MDNPKEYFSTLFNFHNSFRQFFNNGLDEPIDVPQGLVICGMGGSAIAGDFIRTLSNNSSKIPVVVYRGYHPPSFIDKNWSVLAISYSGNTEETISCVKHFLSVGSKITVVTSGGTLEDMAKSFGFRLFKIPAGLQPREAFYHIFGLIAGLLNTSLGLNITTDILEKLDSLHQDLTNSQESLQELCPRFLDSQIMILAPDFLYPVALRFRCQLNENSKLHAASFEVPEFSHNAIIGFDGNFSDRILMVNLRGSLEDSRTAIHLDFAQRLTKNPLVFHSLGQHPLLQLLSLVTRLDFITISLAILQRIDPHAIPSINNLKQILREKQTN